MEKFRIDFEFEGGSLQKLMYGFCGADISQELNEYLCGLNYKSSTAWPLYQFMDYYR
jgi:hypothetical protein